MSKQIIQSKKVVEKSATSTLTKEWESLFLTNIQTQTESKEFMQALTNILVSNISQRRQIYSPSLYSEKKLGEESVFVRNENSERNSKLFDTGISNVLEEIPNQYMRKFYLEILTVDEQVFEYYTIKYKYLTGPSSSELNYTDMSEIQNSTLNLLKQLNQRVSTWPMLKKFKIQFRITYYEDVVPPGYTPELFFHVTPPNRRLLPNFRRVLIGHVQTGHHVLRLEAATIRNFDPSQLNYPQGLIANRKIFSDFSSDSSTVKLPEPRPNCENPTRLTKTSKSSTKKQSGRKRKQTQTKRKGKDPSQMNYPQCSITSRKVFSDFSSDSSTIKLAEPYTNRETPIDNEESDCSTKTSESSTKKQFGRKRKLTQTERKGKKQESPNNLKLSKLIEQVSDFERFKLSTIPEESIEENENDGPKKRSEENTQESDDEIIPETPPQVQPKVNLSLNQSIDLAFATDLTHKESITPQALKSFFERHITMSESEFQCYCKYTVREDLFICQNCHTVHHRACYDIMPKMPDPINLCCVECAYADPNLECTKPSLLKFLQTNEHEELINHGRYCRLRVDLYNRHELRTEELFKNYGIPEEIAGKALRTLLVNNVIKPSNVKDVFIVNKTYR